MPPEPPAVRDLIDVLEAAAELVARPGNRFLWSPWDDAAEARAELRGLIAALRGDARPDRVRYAVVFAPTGPLQELAIDSGWGDAFLVLAERFDRVAGRIWGADGDEAGDAPEPVFGCARCWPDDAEAAWAARAALERDMVLIDASHVIAALLRCRACDQVFLSVFTERIDWTGGDDPQSWTVLPLTPAEAAGLRAHDALPEAALDALGAGRRSLRREHPSDGAVRVYWGAGLRVGPHD